MAAGLTQLSADLILAQERLITRMAGEEELDEGRMDSRKKEQRMGMGRNNHATHFFRGMKTQIWCLWMVVLVAATDITEIDEHAGLIFQQMGSVVRYKNTWRIVYFLPMREIRTNLQAIVRKAVSMDSVKKLLIEQEVLNSVDLTNRAPSSISEIRPILELMTTEIHEIARVLYDNGKLLFPEKKREKRSLLPVVGSLIDFLFGNIDEKTFNKLKQKLENVREKQGISTMLPCW